jgi:hypothetical protein
LPFFFFFFFFFFSFSFHDLEGTYFGGNVNGSIGNVKVASDKHKS